MSPDDELFSVKVVYTGSVPRDQAPRDQVPRDHVSCDKQERIIMVDNWLHALPPSDEQLRGKLFEGWYQSRDITNYSLPNDYITDTLLLDMKVIIDNVPQFIVSTRDVVAAPSISLPPTSFLHEEDEDEKIKASNKTATNVYETDSRLVSHNCPDCKTKTSDPTVLYIMLDYLLEISVPQHLLSHFKTFQNRVQNTSPQSRPQSAHRSAMRWVFTVCHCPVSECYGNLFHSLDNFVPVLVVSYDSYHSYTQTCDKHHVIVRLPPAHHSTTGYAKYWIQLIAKKLMLHQIWILDDQVKSVCRTVPHERLPLVKQHDTWRLDELHLSERLVSFSHLMKHVERVLLDDEDANPENPISVMGISNEVCALTEPFHYNIPSGIVLMNIRNLREVKFHPELHQIEDQVLACEAVKNGQRVFVCNSFVLLDSNWNV